MTETETAMEPPSLLRISSVHSMRDIPFASLSESPINDVSFSHSVSSIQDHQSNNSSRLVNVSEPPQPKHSSIIKIDDLYALQKTRSRLEADIDMNGPTTINAIILSSVFERLLFGITEILPFLYSTDDTTQFSSTYYPLRDVIAHLDKVGPMGTVFPHSSQLSELIKWDFRQLINSFLTLLRTSPGFVATAYLELSSMDRKLLLGYQRGDYIEEVMSAQRLSPLGILFHGMIRDRTERINYFAAASSQLLLEDHDELFNTLLLKFAKPLFFNNKSAAKKMDLALRRALKCGGCASVPSAVNTCSTQTSVSIQHHDTDKWQQTCARILEILTEYIDPDFSQFVATMVELTPNLRPQIHSAAIKKFKALLKSTLTSPHTFALLEDVYISEHVQKIALQPLYSQLCNLIDSDETFTCKLCGSDVVLGDINSYYEHNQLIVLSLSDIVFLYQALLPPKKGSSPQAPADDNEWCLDNIQADLEPVMKELGLKLPTARNRIVRDQQALFMEFWQVFKIEQDGLVNDMDVNSWCPEHAGISGLVVPEFANVDAVLAKSIQEAEANAEFVSLQALKRIQSNERPLNALVHELEKSCQLLTSHKQELHNILDQQTTLFHELKSNLAICSRRLSMSRLFIWYEQEVRISPVYLRSQEVVSLLRGELALQRSNSGSSVSSRRFSARPNRRLSILSGASVMDSFFVSKDYLLKPKLADREIEITMKYLRSEHVHNFCRSEELIQRFNCEMFMLLNRILDRDFLTSTSSCYKKDVRVQGHAPSSHRMSMSVLPDISSTRNRNRKSSPNLLLDIFEWKSVDSNAHQRDWSMGLDSGIAISSPDRDLLTGLLLSDLGSDFLAKGSETDEFMQQTGRMLLDGDGSAIQPILEHISMQNTPRNKLEGVQTLIQVVRAKVEAESTTGLPPSRHDVNYELSKLLGREPGSLYADLQIISGFVPSSVMESVEDGQPFWDVAEAALKILDQVVSKSMDLATRMLRYNETVKSTSLVTAMGVNDAVSIWSFCARNGRPKAQRKLAELYLNYSHTLLEVMPFTKPAILFEGFEPTHVRNVVVAHWMQLAAQKGESKAVAYCKQLQKIDFM